VEEDSVNVLARLAPAFQQSGGEGGAALAGSLPGIILGIFVVVCIWRIFTKAGEPGWYSIIPLWNTIVMLKIAGRPWWWLILFLIPFVNLVFLILAMVSLAKSFGRSTMFGIIMLTFCSFIGLAMLAFGGSRYVGPGGQPAYS